VVGLTRDVLVNQVPAAPTNPLASRCASGSVFRLTALYRAWEEPLREEAKSVVIDGEGRLVLGRKLAGKSQRELHVLGLLTDAEDRRDQRRRSRRFLVAITFESIAGNRLRACESADTG
jgi:hypothetical protein